MTIEHVINNVKSELNTRLAEYECKIEEFNYLAKEHPEYPKYIDAALNYETKYKEVEDILKHLNDYAW